MNIYTNQIGIGIAEMVRLRLFDNFNGETKDVGTVVMHVEVFENLIGVMQKTLDQHKDNMAKQALENKKLS